MEDRIASQFEFALSVSKAKKIFIERSNMETLQLVVTGFEKTLRGTIVRSLTF